MSRESHRLGRRPRADLSSLVRAAVLTATSACEPSSCWSGLICYADLHPYLVRSSVHARLTFATAFFDPEYRMLSEIARVLRPGGMLNFEEPEVCPPLVLLEPHPASR